MKRTGTARAVTAAVALLLTAVACETASGASLFDPAHRFRTLPTEHFVIHFHQGEDALARRMARIAEDTWHALEQSLGLTPPRRTLIVLADQTELFNGFATPVPYDSVVLYAVAPSGSSSDFDDWLRLLFTHEFTHIVHLDRSEGWARVARNIFGRTPYVFPNLFLPLWQVEGLATYEESAITGQGRLHAGEFRAIVGEAAGQGRLEPIDRVNGGLTDWPAGQGIYAYGLGFHQYLADRFGAESLAALAKATAGRVPYLAAPAFMHVYQRSLGDLWRDYETSLAATAVAVRPDPSITRLTHQGFSMNGPRFDRFGCAGCQADIVYSAVDADGFPAIYRVAAGGGEPHRLTTRYLGSTTALAPDRIYFDQLELRRNTGLYSDLYALTRADGRVRRLTTEARLLDPDISPDGRTLVCVQNRPGQRDLVLVRLPAFAQSASARPRRSSAESDRSGGAKPDTAGAPAGLKARTTTDKARNATDVVQAVRPAMTTLIADPGTQFDAPKWSPDGRTIAVERHRLGGAPEIVLVDAETHAVRVVAADPRTRFVTPAWRPDGAAIVVAAAPDDEAFNLFEFAADGSGARQLTHTTGGATWPDVSPDGKRIVFVGYTPDGDDLFAMPYPSGSPAPMPLFPTPPVVGSASATELKALAAPDTPPQATPRGYNPLDTLRPTSWMPVVEGDGDQVRVGAGVGGVDVLGYHAYAAAVTWLVSAPTGAPRPSPATPDWQIYYLYDRWRPAFYVSASSDTSFFAGPVTDAGTPTQATRRERQLEAGVIVPVRHTRVQHAARASILRADADYTLSGGAYSRERTAIRAAWQTNTARSYGYSISHEDGITVGVTAEMARRALGSFADATTTTADGRAYLRGLAPHHVFAVRVAGGASHGDATVGRVFLLGGPSPGTGVVDFDSDAFSLLRGFSADSFAGSRAAVANAEYRWPIARPQRGHGTWPLFLHTVHAAIFADAGNAWTGVFDRHAIKSSAGAQLSADLVAGFFAPFTLSAGAAWGHDGSHRVDDGVTAYFRVGKAF
jgi:hypothetical protein